MAGKLKIICSIWISEKWNTSTQKPFLKRVYHLRIPVMARRMGFPHCYNPISDSRVGINVKTIDDPIKKNHPRDPILNSDSETEYHNHKFPQFIFLEAAKIAPLTGMSPLLIQKSLSKNITPKNIKKPRDGILLMEIDKKKISEHFITNRNIPRN